MRRFRSIEVVVLTLGLSAVPASAAACTSAESRQFDFWLGDWAVYSNGRLAGTNVVTKEFGGCVIQEQWRSLRRRHFGGSFNQHDASRGRWHQTWVDSDGMLLLLDGNWKDGRMVLEGERKDSERRTVRDRISFQPMAEGRVRQLWEASRDGGLTWTVVFDGLYVSRGTEPPAGAIEQAQALRSRGARRSPR